MASTINASTVSGIVQSADTSGVLALQTAGTTAMTISASQNVGIGTTSPPSSGSGYNTLSLNGSIGAQLNWQSNGTTKGYSFCDTSNMIIGTTGALSFDSNSTTRMTIDTSGRVTTPYQPAFSAYGTQISLPTNSTVIPNTVELNTGSYYSTSTGRFTAPVAGMYYFIGTLDINGATQGNYYGFQFNKNGAGRGQGIWVSPYTTNDNSVTQAIVLSLAANDYVTINSYYQNTPATTYSNFSGFLIG